MNTVLDIKHLTQIALCIALVSVWALPTAEAQRLGAGVHYWSTVDSLSDGFDRSGPSWFITYQNSLTPLMAYQLDVERFPSGFAGSSDAVYAPQFMLLLGHWIYAGVGIGILYADNDFANKPFYLLRAGLDIAVLPKLRLDIHANYHFSEWRGIRDAELREESDVITAGVALRFSF